MIIVATAASAWFVSLVAHAHECKEIVIISVLCLCIHLPSADPHCATAHAPSEGEAP
jgi:hypothetical protein